jgi:murein DD-endopeptidase MepM/ murein hydrolase activator NlpD
MAQAGFAILFGSFCWLLATRWWWPVATVPAGAERMPKATSLSEAVSTAPAGADRVTVPRSDADAKGADDLALLRDRNLLVPVRGVAIADLSDAFGDSRGDGRRHEAIDIAAPRDTPVVAVDDGRIEKLWESELGGRSVYQFDPSGRFCYYYAHLERYPRGLREGDRVRRGEIVGYVGSSGNAPRDWPHLHFAIFRLGPDRLWWRGEPINPYRVWVRP